MTGAPAKLFVSSSLVESHLATTVIAQLSNAFTGALQFTHARDLGAGDLWKAWIRKSLNECDAGLFLVTPRYVSSQWLSAEFTAFWLSEKPIYVLLFPDIEASNLFAPMRDDYQATSIGDADGLKKFLTNLAQLCGRERVPYEHTDLISFKALEAFEECQPTAAPEPGVIDPYDNAPADSTYPRRHRLLDLTWDLELGDDGDTLRATSTRTEQFICQSPVMHYVRVAVSQKANLLPFRTDEDFDVELLEADCQNRRVDIGGKSVSSEGYSFQLNFHPPLEAGTEVKVRYRFTLPALKVGTKEKLRAVLLENPDLELRSFESFVIQVLNPTDQYRYTVNFAPNCLIDPLPPEATWRGAPYTDETATLQKGAYSCTRTQDGGYSMRIERTKPAVQTRYTLKWQLPSRNDMGSR